MGLRDLLKKAAAEPVLTWNVEFEKGGRTYTYQRTKTAFRELLAERHLSGREAPFRVTVVVDGKPVEVKVDVG